MRERQNRRDNLKSHFLVLLWAVGLVCGFCAFCSGAQKDRPAVLRNRVFTLKHISAGQARKYLSELKIGDTVSLLPNNANSLLVTAKSQDLIKAAAVLQLVDTNQRFTKKTILKGATADDMPASGALAAKLAGISIGTFAEPPIKTHVNKAIIDIHNGDLIVIASAEQVDQIASVVERLRQTKSTLGLLTEQSGQLHPDADEPLSDVLALLEKEQQIADGEQGRALAKANEPSVTTNTAEEPNQTRETGKPEEPEQLTEPEKVVEANEVEQEPSETVTSEPQQDEQVAVEPDSVQEETSVEQTLELDLPEKLAVIDLLDLVGKYLDLDYMYDEADLKDKFVTLRIQGPIKVKELYVWLESVLKFKDLAMSRTGNLVTIVPSKRILAVDPSLLRDGDKARPGDVIVTRIFRLKHIDTNSAKNLLTKMELGASIEGIADTGTLIVTGYEFRMKRIGQLLELVDQPGEPRQFKFRQLKYTMASVLAPKIASLANQLGTLEVTIGEKEQPKRTPPARRGRPPAKQSSRPSAKEKLGVYLDFDERTNRVLIIGLAKEIELVEQLIDAFDVPEQDLRTIKEYEIQYADPQDVLDKLNTLGIISIGGSRQRGAAGQRRAAQQKGAAAAAAGTGALGGEPQIVVLEMTNSLLVNATAEQHAVIAMIIAYVDREPVVEAIPYVIYPLENQDPTDMKTVLDQLVEKTIKAKAKDEGDKIVRTGEKREDIAIVADENTFSLIVYGKKKNQEWIASLIKALDKRRPQVLIDVSLVEIRRNEDFEYDLNLVANAKSLVTGNTVIKETEGLPYSLAKTVLEGGFNLRDKDGKNSSKFQGFYSEDRIQALLTIMDTKGYGRVLARPKILVNDNEEGKIYTTEKTHIAEETVSYPGDPPHEVISTKYNPYEAKIELSITPHISEGNLLRLKVFMTREDFVEREDAPAGTPPDYTTSNIETEVTVPDGSTIILGGLTKLDQTKGGSKVPLLGDIPLAGVLFRSIGNSNTEKKLYIFVKANIVRPDEAGGLAQLQQISDKNKATFEKAEERFQKHQAIPGIEPEPMDPLKVLEEEG